MATEVVATNHDLPLVVEDLLDRARKCGATEADVLVGQGDTLSVQVRLSAVDRLTKAKEQRLGLRVFFGKRSASASTSDFSTASLDRVVSETCALAKAVAEDDVSGLPAAELMATDRPDLGLFDSTVLETDIQIELARRAEAAAMGDDTRITNSEGSEFNSLSGRVVFGNSHGFLGEFQSSSFSLSVSPIATDPVSGVMQRDSWYAIQRQYAKLEAPESVGREAARRAVRRLGSRKIATRRAPVVFDQETAGSLLANLNSAVSGYALYRGASFLVGRLGDRVASEHVTVLDDGRIPGGLGSRPFDGEGLPTRRTTVVERGVLKSYLLDCAGATRFANQPRPTNLYLVPGALPPAEIIHSVREGLYVTELIGFGINMVTGDYSRGAAGFWIENGELAYPVEEITIAGNLKEMLSSIEMVGNDLEFRGRITSPTIKIRDMMIAGT